jgi:hypothetical protein
MNFFSTADIGYIEMAKNIYSCRGAEKFYRYKGRVTRDSEKTKIIFTLLPLGES